MSDYPIISELATNPLVAAIRIEIIDPAAKIWQRRPAVVEMGPVGAWRVSGPAIPKADNPWPSTPDAWVWIAETLTTDSLSDALSHAATQVRRCTQWQEDRL